MLTPTLAAALLLGAVETLFSLVPCLVFPCGGILGLLALIFWVWMIAEVATKEPAEGNDKLVWLLVVILLNWVGALIYFAVRRSERIRRYGR